MHASCMCMHTHNMHTQAHGMCMHTPCMRTYAHAQKPRFRLLQVLSILLSFLSHVLFLFDSILHVRYLG